MPKWDINLSLSSSAAQSLKQYEQLDQPFGFSVDATDSSVEHPRKRQMIENKLWEVATASKTQILMTVFMFWMFGNNISIFVIFPIIQTLMSAIGGLLKYNKVFEQYEGMVGSMGKYKLVYLLIHLILLGIVLYKLSAMGLLPVSAPDYIDLIPPFETKYVLGKA